ncbi:MAG TPA: DNA-processing protein DprA [Bryobacteraceae bacterium]|nr:DNA-processing protein DprA [Bryobacteraceae bacterium]
MAQAACFDFRLSDEDILHWLALRMAPGLGTRKAGQLVSIFRTPQAIFRASRSELESAGLSPAAAQSIASGCAFEDAVTQQQKLAEAGAVLIPLTDSRYPPRLKEIYDPPPVLFARGRIDLLASLMLGVVGTRRPTTYGTTAAARLSKDLSSAGLTIVSGMARGIDTAAQRAALESGGNTVAVFGCGVDEVYPAENRKLAGEIAENGLVISEFPMGMPPYPQNFPVRNRIVSGMSAGVLIVEGGEYSGSSITARLAAEQNREIFAVPGNITSKMSWGPNLLIKQGAKLVQDWNDVVVELDPEDRRRLVDQCRNKLNLNGKEEPESSGGNASSTQSGPMQALSRAILRELAPDAAVPLDNLIENLAGTGEGRSSSEIIAALFELELTGLIRQLPGKRFLKIWAG